MRFEVNKHNIKQFKYILWFNLFIGIYNIYLYSIEANIFSFIIGSINIGVWVFLRKVEV